MAQHRGSSKSNYLPRTTGKRGEGVRVKLIEVENASENGGEKKKRRHGQFG